MKKWAACASFISTCSVAVFCVTASLSLAERIVAKDTPLRGDMEVDHGERVMANRLVGIGPSQYGHYITRANINGVKVAALIDTGASVVALSYEDAERAGLNPLRLKFDRRVRTANGIANAAPVTLSQVVVEGILVKNVEGMVMRKGAMRGTLLGMSFLRRLQGFRLEHGTLYLED
ncbi:MAG: TIGR02281 family clan AA aspartic protease [Rhizobiales bacterium]|nr:TIGR02281 family clan AA aspartic protease [Hyphomicrobiales bacterium]